MLVWSASTSVAALLFLLVATHCLLDGKADSEQDANASNSDVSCTKEGVLASDPCCGGKHDLLGARELGDREHIIDSELDCLAFLEIWNHTQQSTSFGIIYESTIWSGRPESGV